MPHGQPWPWQAPPPPVRPPSKNRGLVIALVALASVIGVTIVVALGFVVAGSDRGDEPRVVSDKERAANAKQVQFLTEFDRVCDTGSVINAAEFQKPYGILAFEERYSGGEYSTLTLSDAPDFVVKDEAALTSVNVVACLSRKRGTEVKSGSCTFDSGDEVDRYAVDYDMVMHEAKSGRIIENLGTVGGPVDGCPVVAFFDSGSPKIYGSPDDSQVIEKLKEFVGSR